MAKSKKPDPCKCDQNVMTWLEILDYVETLRARVNGISTAVLSERSQAICLDQLDSLMVELLWSRPKPHAD